MIDELKAKIETVNSNIEVLPKNNKRNKAKCVEYIEEELVTYRKLLNEAREELKLRYDNTLAKYKDFSYEFADETIDYNSMKLSDNRVSSSEKMNLDYLFYKLDNVSNNLSEVSKIFMEMVKAFEFTGIKLSLKDFMHSQAVNTYIKALVSNDPNIEDIFNNLYWENSNIIKQVELNFKYLYYKNQNKINNFYKSKYESFDFHGFMEAHRKTISDNDTVRHTNIKYIYDLFISKVYDPADFMAENRVQDLLSRLLVDSTLDKNYEILLKLRKSLIEYKGYDMFKYMIDDFKELFSHKEEYKGLFDNLYKEISKLESKLFSLNSTINKTGLFKPNKNKISSAKLERNKVFDELYEKYKELDSLKIKDFIYKHVTSNNNYYEVFKFVTYNFYYFVELLEKNNDDLSMGSIDNILLQLQGFIYDYDIDVLDNISISEDKDVASIIVDMYVLNNIKINVEDLEFTKLDKYIESVDKLLLYYDLFAVELDMKDIDFLLQVPVLLQEKGKKVD